MESSPSEPPPSTRPRPDLDFVPDPFPAAAFPPGLDPADGQHLVVNPFLAVAALAGWAWMTLRLFRGAFPPLALIPTLLLGWLPFLVHYHCLDCGATGPYPRWRRHACPAVVRRAQRAQVGWLAWPRAWSQLVVWLYVLGAAGFLLALAGLTVRAIRPA